MATSAPDGFAYHADALPVNLEERLLAAIAIPIGEERQMCMLGPESFDADILDLLRTAVAAGLIEAPVNAVQFIVYPDGTGFTSHLDSAHRWGHRIVTFSLQTACELLLQKAGVATFRQVLEARSAYVLTGPARYDWKHGISRRKRGGPRVAVVLRSTKAFARAATLLFGGQDDDGRHIADDAGRRLSEAAAREAVAEAAPLVLALMDKVGRM